MGETNSCVVKTRTKDGNVNAVRQTAPQTKRILKWISNEGNLMFIGPCIIAIVDEWKTNLMSLAISFHLLCAQHVRLVLGGVRFANSRTKSSNTQRTENKTTDVVIHQYSSKLLMMDILMSETCWAHNKWNKIASDNTLAFHSSITHSYG